MDRLDMMNELLAKRVEGGAAEWTDYAYSLIKMTDADLSIEYENVFKPKGCGV